uniref:Retrotransposon gag domain-containing protein n=1 Tax=Chenopodium quinoa TaxID=63459 RepID=A0A803MYU5_CHEQI
MVVSQENRSFDDRFKLPKLGYSPKLDLPKFDGSNPRIWIKKCCKYFILCEIPNDKKVYLTSLNMVDKAKNWMSSYLANRFAVDWIDFIIGVTSIFKDDKGLNVVEEFIKLQQTSSIESYIDEFENLRSIMLQNAFMLLEKYLLEFHWRIET